MAHRAEIADKQSKALIWNKLRLIGIHHKVANLLHPFSRIKGLERTIIMSKIIQAIFVLFSLVIASFTYSSINNSSSIDLDDNKSILCEDLGKTESSSPETYYQNILQLFMESVERGELVLFDNVIYKDSLKPLRIECHYDIEEKSRTVSIYSVLLVEIYHPTAPEFRIDGITAVLDQYGNITEVIAHIGSSMPWQ